MSENQAQNDQWYMIEYDLIDREVLAANNIPFAPLEVVIGDRRNRTNVVGVSFPASELPKVLELFELSTLINKTPTNERNVILLEQPIIEITENNIDQLEDILSVLKDYAHVQKKNIVVSNPHGRGQNLPKRKENTLYIYFWSVPVRYSREDYPTVFDIELGRNQQQGTAPSGLGIQLRDNNGRVVAEVHNDSVLYILFDLSHSGAYAGPLLERILQEWSFLSVTPEERIAILAEQEAELQRKSLGLYIAAITTRATAHKQAMKDELGKVNGTIDTHRTELVSLLRRQLFLVEQVHNTTFDTSDIEAKMAAEFQQLESLPHVKKVRLQDNLLLVYTDVLHSQQLEDGTVRELGEYIIRIGLNGQTIRVQNTTRLVDGQYHPHDMGEGLLCLGNFGEGISQLVAQYQFYNLTMMMIHFLKNPNEHDQAGKQIYDWPKVRQTKETK